MTHNAIVVIGQPFSEPTIEVAEMCGVTYLSKHELEPGRKHIGRVHNKFSSRFFDQPCHEVLDRSITNHNIFINTYQGPYIGLTNHDWLKVIQPDRVWPWAVGSKVRVQN